MTTNKPEVFEVYRTKQGTLENVVLLADYESLQAECDHYKSAIAEITTRHFAERWVNAASNKELEQYLSDGIAQLEDEHREQIEALQAECEKLREGLDAVQDLIDSSYGVAGLHLNGDVASWSDLRQGGAFEEWMIDFDAAMRENQP